MRTYIGRRADLYEAAAGEYYSLFIVPRHRAPSSLICLSDVSEQALRFIARIPLIQRRKKHRSRKEKSAFP